MRTRRWTVLLEVESLDDEQAGEAYDAQDVEAEVGEAEVGELLERGSLAVVRVEVERDHRALGRELPMLRAS